MTVLDIASSSRSVPTKTRSSSRASLIFVAKKSAKIPPQPHLLPTSFHHLFTVQSHLRSGPSLHPLNLLGPSLRKTISPTTRSKSFCISYAKKQKWRRKHQFWEIQVPLVAAPYVCSASQHCGVYDLQPGSWQEEEIQACAGGFTNKCH